jgi:hypothetical protein
MEKKGSEGTGRECLSSSRVTFGRSSLSARRIMLVPWWLLFFCGQKEAEDITRARGGIDERYGRRRIALRSFVVK